MKIPEEFMSFSLAFYFGSSDDYATWDERIEDSIDASLTKEEQVGVKRFLDLILADGYSDQDLELIWRKTSPTYNFSAGGHRVFFTLAQEALNKRLGGIA